MDRSSQSFCHIGGKLLDKGEACADSPLRGTALEPLLRVAVWLSGPLLYGASLGRRQGVGGCCCSLFSSQ